MDRTAVAAAAGRPHKKPRTLSYTIVDCLQDPSQPLSQIDEALVEIDCRHASTEAPRLMGDPETNMAGEATWFRHLAGITPPPLDHTSCTFCGSAVYHIPEHSRDSSKCVGHRTDSQGLPQRTLSLLNSRTRHITETDILQPTLSDVPTHRVSEDGVAEQNAEQHIRDIATHLNANCGIYE